MIQLKVIPRTHEVLGTFIVIKKKSKNTSGAYSDLGGGRTEYSNKSKKK